MRLSLCLFAAALSLAACTSTYHPEYHPVTATSVTQTYVSNPGAATPTPATPAGAVIIQQPPAANPDQFFDTPQR